MRCRRNENGLGESELQPQGILFTKSQIMFEHVANQGDCSVHSSLGCLVRVLDHDLCRLGH